MYILEELYHWHALGILLLSSGQQSFCLFTSSLKRYNTDIYTFSLICMRAEPGPSRHENDRLREFENVIFQRIF